MRWNGLWLSALLLMVCWSKGPGADESAKEKTQRTTIDAETIPLKQGGGLSSRTPVVRPGAIKGVRSWTIETRRHRWSAIDLVLSPDGKVVATSGYDGMIRLWNARTGDLQRVLVGHDSYVYGLAWSADGRYLASAGSHDGTVRVWDARTGLPLRVLKGLKDAALVVAWSPDGSLLAAGTGGSGYVPIWTIASGTLVKMAETGKPVLGLTFSPDGKTLACGVSEVGVSLLAAPEWTAADKIDLPGQSPRTLSYSSDGKQLALASNKHALVWDLVAKKVLYKLDGATSGLARHDNQLAVTGTTGKVWEPGVEKPSALLPGSQAVAWSRDGKMIYLLYGDEIVTVDPSNGKVPHRWSVAGSGNVWWFPDRPVLTGVGTVEPRLWEATTGKLLHPLKGHTAPTTTAAWSPGGKVLATGGHDKTVRVWNPSTGKLLRTLAGFGAPVTALAVSGNGRIAAGSGDGKVRVYLAEALKPSQTEAAHTEAVKALAWGRDGRLASGGLDAAVRLWGSDAKKPSRRLEIAGSVETLAFSPNGKWLAAGASDNRVNVWSYPVGKLVHEWTNLGSPPAVNALAWAPDSNGLLSGRANHSIQLWDLKLAKNYRQSIGVMAPVQSVSWAAGGKTMVSCTLDRSVRFWNAATGQMLATLIAEKDQLACIAAEGHYRVPSDEETELVYVALTTTGMDTLAPKAFGARFGWKNNPMRARMIGR